MTKERKRKHEDTTVSLAPLTFEQAIDMLTRAPKRADSPAAASETFRRLNRNSNSLK
jgi:hypothetical protein